MSPKRKRGGENLTITGQLSKFEAAHLLAEMASGLSSKVPSASSSKKGFFQ